MTNASIKELVPILYEDDDVLAVAKPSGIDSATPEGRTSPGLSEYLAELRGQGETFHTANRLNRYESGVLLLGKNPAIAQALRTALRNNEVTQEFTAVVLGKMSRATLVIDAGHGASRGRRGSVKGAGKRPPAPKERTNALNRQTTVSAIHRGSARTVVRCQTVVASTHALRAQLRAVRLRLLGDNLHDETRRKHETSSTCLHLSKIAFKNPGTGVRTTVRCRVPEAFSNLANGAQDTERPLLAALIRRLPLLASGNTDAYRLITGGKEDLKGVVAERFGEVVTLQISDDRGARGDMLSAVAKWYKDKLGVKAVYAKRFVKNRTDVDEDTQRVLHSPHPLAGSPAPPEIRIREYGIPFIIRPYEGFSVGLFLDQRDNRRRIRAQARGKDVLNLFAYTCGFSVAAAAGGAASTVSVDLSPKALEWGRANFALSHLDPSDHQFIKSDAFDYLRRAARQGKRFDIIILDPPSFAHGRKGSRTFSIARDLPALVAASTPLLRPGGTMMVSTNYRQLPTKRLRELVKEGSGRRRIIKTETPRLPQDFAADPDHAKTVIVEFD